MADETQVKKAGWKTSEFWLTVLANIVGTAIQFDMVPTEAPWAKAVAFVAQILATMGYTYSRTQAKK